MLFSFGMKGISPTPAMSHRLPSHSHYTHKCTTTAEEQEHADATWLTNMAMRCIKEQDDETKKIDAFLCEKFGMNWKAEILFDAVKSGNI